jgi:hypothetical protein
MEVELSTTTTTKPFILKQVERYKTRVKKKGKTKGDKKIK